MYQDISYIFKFGSNEDESHVHQMVGLIWTFCVWFSL